MGAGIGGTDGGQRSCGFWGGSRDGVSLELSAPARTTKGGLAFMGSWGGSMEKWHPMYNGMPFDFSKVTVQPRRVLAEASSVGTTLAARTKRQGRVPLPKQAPW